MRPFDIPAINQGGTGDARPHAQVAGTRFCDLGGAGEPISCGERRSPPTPPRSPHCRRVRRLTPRASVVAALKEDPCKLF